MKASERSASSDATSTVAIGGAFEDRLVRALQPIRRFVLAIAIYQLFDSGLFKDLAQSRPVSTHELARRRGLDYERLDALLRYLRNEGIVLQLEGGFALAPLGEAFAEAEPWYTMLVGGYAESFLQIGRALRSDADAATRNGAKVGVGSCGISHYDAIPLTRELMNGIPGGCRSILDLGCGNALYLSELCGEIPSLEAWGVEPDEGGYQAAIELVKERGLEGRIRLARSTAAEFLQRDLVGAPDAVVLGFVLHEILGQEGEHGVELALARIVDRFPAIHLIVIEVDWRVDDLPEMQSGLALAYYNPYFLFHPFTRQRLQRADYWERKFRDCGLEIVDKRFVDPAVDSTGLEVGYLLSKASAVQ
jgi:2-ketoarginine methyltransferase